MTARQRGSLRKGSSSGSVFERKLPVTGPRAVAILAIPHN
jgi:hypothetical protein